MVGARGRAVALWRGGSTRGFRAESARGRGAPLTSFNNKWVKNETSSTKDGKPGTSSSGSADPAKRATGVARSAPDATKDSAQQGVALKSFLDRHISSLAAKINTVESKQNKAKSRKNLAVLRQAIKKHQKSGTSITNHKSGYLQRFLDKHILALAAAINKHETKEARKHRKRVKQLVQRPVRRVLGKASGSLKHTLAQRKIKRSLNWVREEKARKQRSNEFCLFYSRFGKCTKSNCRYQHDPRRVSVCWKWLNGKCDGTKCSLSHDNRPEKMPFCTYFMRGNCTNDPCMYLHVKVDRNAPPCEDFVSGYCERGLGCKKMHTLVCDAFLKGECKKGSSCKMFHPKKRAMKAKKISADGSDQTPAARPPQKEEGAPTTPPLRPSFLL